MPEIKHQFTGGKMNKDVDERLVPNGEYRDAMNVQVSTSEGSDVGTIQNVLGNKLGCTEDFGINNGFTVGSVADEKNDELYWLVSGQPFDSADMIDNFSNWTNANNMSDMILRKTLDQYGNDLCEPIFVDQFAFSIANSFVGATNQLQGVPLDMVEPGWTVTGVSADGGTSNTSTIISENQQQGISVDFEFVTSTTPTINTQYWGSGAHGNGGGLYIPMNMVWVGQSITYVQSTGNVVYWASPLAASYSPALFVGHGIEILPVSQGNLQADVVPPGTVIISATHVNLQYSPNSSQQVMKLTLSNNLTALTGSTAPHATLLNLQGVLEEYLGNTIDALVSNEIYEDIPTGEIILPSAVGGYNINLNDPVSILGVSGCVNTITLDATSITWGSITINDCTNSTPIIPSNVGASAPKLRSGALYTAGEFEINLDTPIDLSGPTAYTSLLFRGPRALNFNHNSYITGINIVDDMLFWTDGVTEPKKINITRSRNGTNPNAQEATKVVNSAQGYAGHYPSAYGPLSKRAGEQHITVVKKSPKTSLTLGLITDRLPDKNYSGLMVISNSATAGNSSFTSNSSAKGIYDFTSFTDQDGSNHFRTIIPYDAELNTTFKLDGWKVGSKVVLKEYDDNSTAPSIPFANYRIKGVIVDWGGNNFDSTNGAVQVSIRIDAIDGEPPTANNTGTRKYVVDLFVESEKLFEFKFPRFSYRYKYEDGEYSTFAPFSPVAFVPGPFDYHSKKGYNLGMVNRVTSVVLGNFVTDDIPEDVVSIDLLYKDDASPSVYLINTVSPKEELSDGDNSWTLNEHAIDNEDIKAIIPSNQLLRSWDNVPKKALAQDVTGSRIVYGNYTQNYNLKIGELNFKPKFKWDLSTRVDSIRSIKSLREYQLGVVFTDKYDRQTPVITNQSGTFKVEKAKSNSSNVIRVGFNGQEVPIDMEYFKFFIKETSGEYYNMAMDRFYDAADGNSWLSFPSSDRNKVDIDSFIILKKGLESNALVLDPARYKVLAIENEAPNFIKTSNYNIGEITHDLNSGKEVYDFTSTTTHQLPFSGNTSFTIQTTTEVNGSSLSSLDEIKEDIYVEFAKIGSTGLSNRYKIHEVAREDTSATTGTLEFFNIKIDGQFGSDVDFISNDPLGFNPSKVEDLVITRFYKYVVENKPEFDGRFFVKIFSDEVFEEHIETNEAGEDTEYRVELSNKIFYMGSFYEHINRHNGTDFGYAVFGNTDPSSDVTYNTLNFENDGYASQNWKYYSAYFASYNDNFVGTSSQENRYNDLKERNVDWSDVWFINKGHHRATHKDTYSMYNDDYTWRSLNSGGGAGIANGYGRMELGFGPIIPEGNTVTGSATVISGSSGYSLLGQSVNFTGTPVFLHKDSYFWDLTNDKRSFYNNMAPFIEGLNSGTQFRWAADPTETIYTIYRETDIYNRVRYNDAGGSGNGISNNGGSMYRGENYNKTYRNWFEPAMTAWNPLEGAADYGACTGSLKIDKYLDDPLNSTTSTQDLVASSFNTAGYFISIDREQFDFSYDQTYKKRTITQGMILTEIGGSALTKPLLISKIEKATNHCKLYLTGYNGCIVDLSSYSANDTLVFQQPIMNGLSVNSAKNISETNGSPTNFVGIEAVGYVMDFVKAIPGGKLLPTNPVVWETEPKENVDLDIYYEISGNNPVNLNASTIKTAIPVNATVQPTNNTGVFPSMLQIPVKVSGTTFDYSGATVFLNQDLCTVFSPTYDAGSGGCFTTFNGAQLLTPNIVAGDKFKITRLDGSAFSVRISEVVGGSEFKLHTFLYNNYHDINWSNCYAFGNGVESNRIRDSFNLPYISKGAKASATLDNQYHEEHRKHGLIYSGIYNSTSGVNNLNQFNAAEKITKDVNPTYGSIQKLYSRSTADGDLIALCEDRVLKILANKDAVFNADGNPQLIATENVLGQTMPFSGEFGISNNPESFAGESYRAYFTDKVRGTVMRLSKDGLTPISDHGMKDWFRDNLKLNTKLIGSHDDKKSEYNITLQETEKKDHNGNSVPTTISFREDVKGWVSFKSFTPENGISCANEYYTFEYGIPWIHHIDSVDRNTFHGSYKNSSFTVLLNDMPGSVKSFTTVNYEGSQARIKPFFSVTQDGVDYTDGNYFNLEGEEGWFVNSAFTNLEKGGVTDFIDKEGKWFGYINGDNITSNFFGIATTNFDTSDFSIQGIGVTRTTPTVFSASGCTDPTAFNYQSYATADDGSCIPFIYGCTDPNNTTNYNSLANSDDGSCLYPGCTDITAFNYDASANYDDGSCIAMVKGCTDPLAFNHDPFANSDDGSCIAKVFGCMDYLTVDGCGVGCLGAMNQGCSVAANPLSTTPCSDGVNTTSISPPNFCMYVNIGCMDSNAVNYVAGATVADPGDPCLFCGDSTANNDDGALNANGSIYYGGCEYCGTITNFYSMPGALNITTTSVYIQWDIPTGSNFISGDWELVVTDTTPFGPAPITTTITPVSAGAYYNYNVTGLTPGRVYDFQLTQVCTNSFGNTASFTQQTNHIPGCMDGSGFGNTSGSWPACNFNPLATLNVGCYYDLCAGCKDPLYSEYCGDCWDATNLVAVTDGSGGPWVGDDSSCSTLIVHGCTDDTAFNYNISANVDDGSCVAIVLGCMDDSPANNGVGFAASNYAGPGNTLGINGTEQTPVVNTDNGTCTKNCPSVYISNTISYMSTASYSSQSLVLNVDLGATDFSMHIPISPGGMPAAYTASSKITEEDATTAVPFPNVITNISSQGDWVVNPVPTPVSSLSGQKHKTKLTFADMGLTAGVDQKFYVQFNIKTNITTANPTACDITSFNEQFTIGCKDPDADNHSSSWHFNDNAACEYTGCMDTTLDNNGNIWASNYNVKNTIPCTVDANGVTGLDNICCEYPVGDVTISSQTNPGLGTNDNYTHFPFFVNFDNTGFTSFTILSLQVTTPGGASWNDDYINGSTANSTWLNALMPTTSDRIQALSTAGGVQAHDGPGVDFNNKNEFGLSTPAPLAHSPLTIKMNGIFQGQTQNFNPSFNSNGIYAPSISLEKEFTGGCKVLPTGAIAADYGNYDNTLDVHIPDSCTLAPVPGCTQTNALNYNSSATQFLANTCCPPTETPNDLVVVATKVASAFNADISFDEVCEALSYQIYLKVNTGGYTLLSTVAAPTFSGLTPTNGSNLNSFPLFALPGSIASGDELSFFVNAKTNDKSFGSSTPFTTISGNSHIFTLIAPS